MCFCRPVHDVQDVSGHVESGHLLAIMGPTGGWLADGMHDWDRWGG